MRSQQFYLALLKRRHLRPSPLERKSKKGRRDGVLTITCTVETTVSIQIGVCEVSTNLLGLAPEIVQAVLLIGQYVSSRDEDGISSDALATVWEVKSVVQSSGSFIVGEAVEIPVHLKYHQLGSFGRNTCLRRVGREGKREREGR